MKNFSIIGWFLIGFFFFSAVPEFCWAFENKPIDKPWVYHLAIGSIYLLLLNELFRKGWNKRIPDPDSLANKIEIKKPDYERQTGGNYPIEECEEQLPDEKEVNPNVKESIDTIINERDMIR